MCLTPPPSERQWLCLSTKSKLRLRGDVRRFVRIRKEAAPPGESALLYGPTRLPRASDRFLRERKTTVLFRAFLPARTKQRIHLMAERNRFFGSVREFFLVCTFYFEHHICVANERYIFTFAVCCSIYTGKRSEVKVHFSKGRSKDFQL